MIENIQIEEIRAEHQSPDADVIALEFADVNADQKQVKSSQDSEEELQPC